MWKKNGNIISVGNQILGNVSITENDWTKFCNLTPISLGSYFSKFYLSLNCIGKKRLPLENDPTEIIVYKSNKLCYHCVSGRV